MDDPKDLSSFDALIAADERVDAYARGMLAAAAFWGPLPVAELAAHVGHRRALQGQGLLGGQPAQPQAWQVAALPAGHYGTGDGLRVDADLGPGAGGPGALVAPAGGPRPRPRR